MTLQHFWLDLTISLGRVFCYSCIAFLASVAVGYLLASGKTLSAILLPLINSFRHVSVFALLPYAIIIFGLGEMPVAVIMIIALFFPAIVMVMHVFQQLPQELLAEASCAGADRWQILVYLQLPLILPNLCNNYRHLFALGLNTLVAAEMLGVNQGLGYRLLDYRYLLNYKAMFVYIGVIAGIGIVTDYVLRKITASIETWLFS